MPGGSFAKGFPGPLEASGHDVFHSPKHHDDSMEACLSFKQILFS